MDEIDPFIPHQANIRIINSAAKRLGIPEERVFVNVHKYGAIPPRLLFLWLWMKHTRMVE